MDNVLLYDSPVLVALSFSTRETRLQRATIFIVKITRSIRKKSYASEKCMRLAGGIVFCFIEKKILQMMVSEESMKQKKKKKNDDGRICKRKFFVKIAGKPEYR